MLMKKSSLTVVCIAVAALFAVSCNLKVEFGKSPVRKVVAAMTLQEKVNLLVCADAGQTYSIPRLGIPSVVLADGSGNRTSFPVSTMLAQSWNQQLVEEVGEAIGDEVKRNGADCLLLPALDLHSNPVVSGKTASAMVRGVQSNGIGATIKHNVLNGHHTTHGQYLKGFEIAVRESQPWALMTRNGVLNDSILHCEWGFGGMVMTELADSSDAVAAIQAGNDLILPGSANHIKAIIEAVQNGNLDEKIIDRNVQNVLAFIERSPKMQGYEIQNDPDLDAHSRISRSIATEGMVLLKNNGALPLARNCKMIALYGTSSYNLYVAGTVNGSINNNHAVSLNEGLKAAGYKLEPSILSAYSRYVDSPQPLVRKPYQYRADAISSDIAIITIGRSFENENDFMLTDIEQGLISDVCDAFHSKGKKVIVVLNIGAPIETASWKSLPDAILLAGIPGQEAGYAITDILKGAVNPSGKLVDTYVIDYDCQKEQVSYPFGFGMSYTKFTYSEPQAKVVEGVVSLSVKITNTGSVAGKEAVQVYIEAPQGNINNQTKEIKTYGKTALLQPGESQTLEFALPNYELAGFDLSTLTWQTVQGEYKAHFAASSQDLRCQALFNIPVSSSYPAYGLLK